MIDAEAAVLIGDPGEMNLSEDQVRIMIDTIPALAWCCLLDGATEFTNKRWLEYTGLSQDEALGWGWRRAVHPEDLEKLIEAWRAVLASGEPGGGELACGGSMESIAGS
jgi:PAS domain S-box-containing protein